MVGVCAAQLAAVVSKLAPDLWRSVWSLVEQSALQTCRSNHNAIRKIVQWTVLLVIGPAGVYAANTVARVFKLEVVLFLHLFLEGPPAHNKLNKCRRAKTKTALFIVSSSGTHGCLAQFPVVEELQPAP